MTAPSSTPESTSTGSRPRHCLSPGAIGAFCRRLHDPCVHVCGHAGFCPGLLHPAHCRRRGGGAGNPGRGTFGAFILVPMSEALRGFGGLRIVFYGVFLVVFVVGLPEGIFHYIQRKYHQFERWVEVEK